MSVTVDVPLLAVANDHADAVGMTATFIAGESSSNTLACLRIGRMLIEAHKTKGVTYGEVAEELRKRGLEPPRPSRASVYMSAYKAWAGTGISWEYLVKLSIDTLYHAGRLIGRMNGINQQTITPHAAYTMAAGSSPGELRALAKSGGVENLGQDVEVPPEPSDVATVKMPRAALEAWDAFAARLGGITGGAVSRTKALEFALSIMGDLSDEILDSAWDSEHGDAPDPNEVPFPFMVVDDEEDEDE